jgi:hypothetical protein
MLNRFSITRFVFYFKGFFASKILCLKQLKNEWRFVQDVGMENKSQIQMMEMLFDIISSIVLFYGRKITCTK